MPDESQADAPQPTAELRAYDYSVGMILYV